MHDLQDETPLQNIWYRDLMSEVGYEMPQALRCLTILQVSSYVSEADIDKSVVITPAVFLPWLCQKLERAGVKFVRKDIKSLSELKDFGHEVLVNATGFRVKFLADVADEGMQQMRGQTVLVKTGHNKIFMRHGKDYTYILCRIHQSLPEIFPGTEPADFDIIRDNVGIRPGRTPGVQFEKEILDGPRIVHTYDTGGGGYVFSFGLARAAGTRSNDFLFAAPKSLL
ncbi:uncharacterized protein BDV17DRAFT_288378 [Aspergillus undulatus]|uniref:uncharacterized protein n=1 Tax=Aspergillus undulatus TaxID=1810928 RepID=UPI003CCD268B